mmetsp:Transcript_53083/g.133615  ORF Transcript_53083/g.133615 Transcript_53083/m.133615 type:complete len:222 (+) Transcript_53083:7422-8087(+)
MYYTFRSFIHSVLPACLPLPAPTHSRPAPPRSPMRYTLVRLPRALSEVHDDVVKQILLVHTVEPQGYAVARLFQVNGKRPWVVNDACPCFYSFELSRHQQRLYITYRYLTGLLLEGDGEGKVVNVEAHSTQKGGAVLQDDGDSEPILQLPLEGFELRGEGSRLCPLTRAACRRPIHPIGSVVAALRRSVVRISKTVPLCVIGRQEYAVPVLTHVGRLDRAT